jgi:hypothetical protein
MGNFMPADGIEARWRKVNEHADKVEAAKGAGTLIPFQEVERLLGVDRQTATGVVAEVNSQRIKESKRPLISARGMGWIVARAEDELTYDEALQDRIRRAAQNRADRLDGTQTRREELNQSGRGELDFKHAHAVAHASMLNKPKKKSAADLLAGDTSKALPGVGK